MTAGVVLIETTRFRSHDIDNKREEGLSARALRLKGPDSGSELEVGVPTEPVCASMRSIIRTHANVLMECHGRQGHKNSLHFSDTWLQTVSYSRPSRANLSTMAFGDRDRAKGVLNMSCQIASNSCLPTLV